MSIENKFHLIFPSYNGVVKKVSFLFAYIKSVLYLYNIKLKQRDMKPTKLNKKAIEFKAELVRELEARKKSYKSDRTGANYERVLEISECIESLNEIINKIN